MDYTGLSRDTDGVLMRRVQSLMFLICTNFGNHFFVNGIKQPFLSGRVFFRFLAQGLAATICKQQFLDATH